MSIATLQAKVAGKYRSICTTPYRAPHRAERSDIYVVRPAPLAEYVHGYEIRIKK